MYRKIKGTEFGGDYNRLDASGVLKDFGIKEIYSLSDVDLGCVLDYLLREKPQPITEHAYMFGKYMVKFYPPESFGFLSYCQQLGLPVESPVAMGVDGNDEGDVVIVDTIGGKDYYDIVLEKRRNLFFQLSAPKREMFALGKTVYMFCLKGIVAGDSKLQNYMYDGTQALRIDLIPQYDSMPDMDWKEINSDFDLVGRYSEELISLINDVGLMFSDMADILTYEPQSRKRFVKSVDAFLRGYVNDELSRYLAGIFWEDSKVLVKYMQMAEKESRSFLDVYFDETLAGAGDDSTVEIRVFGH